MFNWGRKKNTGVSEAHLFLFVFLFQIFMKPDFALEDSLTFNAVLPWSHFSTAGGKGNRDAASSKLLQEKVQTLTKAVVIHQCLVDAAKELHGCCCVVFLGFAVSHFPSGLLVNHAGSMLLKEDFFLRSVHLSSLEKKNLYMM